jgi:hypothetical protein
MKQQKPSKSRLSYTLKNRPLDEFGEQERQPVRKRRRTSNVGYVLASGFMLALVGLFVDLRSVFRPPATTTSICQQVIQPQAILARDQLAQLLTIPERSTKAQVREIIKDPYCQLADVEVRAGVMAQREAYPLAFDPDTWFVVLYEGDEYAGYDFSFHH